MKKKVYLRLLTLAVLAILLCSCAKDPAESTPAGTSTPTATGNEASSSPTATDKPTPTDKPASTPTEAATPTATPEPTKAEIPADVWVPDFLLNQSSEGEEADTYAGAIKICEEGQFLFSGKTNESYRLSDASLLVNAPEGSALAIAFACDDVSHAGWGVLGVGSNVNGKWSQFDITAYSEEPTKERLEIYTMPMLAKALGAKSMAETDGLTIGAWNGGRIAGVYFLDYPVTVKLTEYLNENSALSQTEHTYDGSLSNENAIESAVTLYEYLKETYGEGCLTGQMESTWMGSPDYEINYVKEASGRVPAIRGLDFMHNDFDGVVERSIAWWEQGGIVTICWHTGDDFASGYNESKADNPDWDKIFDPTTKEYTDFLAAMDRAVPYLQKLEDAGVPVLWRPFHELDGGWFWWSKGGSKNFVTLWKLMYERYTEYWGLDNLIWVLGYSHNGRSMEDWYPGDEYVDLTGADSYTRGANDSLFESVEEVAPEGMPLVFHECGTIPTEEELKASDTDWLFFMVWHTDYITDAKNNTKASIKEIYNSDYFITLDELPAFK